jgi:hypothetical protein
LFLLLKQFRLRNEGPAVLIQVQDTTSANEDTRRLDPWPKTWAASVIRSSAGLDGFFDAPILIHRRFFYPLTVSMVDTAEQEICLDQAVKWVPRHFGAHIFPTVIIPQKAKSLFVAAVSDFPLDPPVGRFAPPVSPSNR